MSLSYTGRGNTLNYKPEKVNDEEDEFDEEDDEEEEDDDGPPFGIGGFGGGFGGGAGPH